MIGLSNKDWQNELDIQAVLLPGAKTATATSSAVDTSNYRRALVVVEVGVWTDGTHTFSLTSGATSGGSFTNDTNILGSFPVISSAPTASKTYVFMLDLDNLAGRWVKVVSTVAGATTGAIYGATIIGFNQRIAG